MEMPLIVLAGSILWIIVLATTRLDTEGKSRGQKIFLVVRYGFYILFCTAVLAVMMSAMLSTGLALVVLATAVLLVPLLVLEVFFVGRTKYMICAKALLFPCLLAGAILYTAWIEKQAIETAEYAEGSPDRYLFEKDAAPVAFAETATLRLTENFPRIEGSTSLGGLFRSLAQATNATGEANLHVYASQTANAYYSLTHGTCDLVFAFHPSREEMATAEQSGHPFRLTPVGREAFVFFVNAQNPVANLTVPNLRDIYSGKITNWRDVGGPNAAITAFQRRQNSGSQSRMERFMAGFELMEPLREHRIWDMGSIVTHVARYRNHRYAIGYSFLFYIQNMVREKDVRMLAVDGVAPSLESIRDGSYPLLDDIYAVTTDRSHPNAEALIAWLLSPQGQRLVLANGYAPVAPVE